MSANPGRLSGKAVIVVVLSTLVLGAALLVGANRLYFDRRPESITPDLLLNEGLLLLSLLVMQALLVGGILGRWFRPLGELGRLLAGEAPREGGKAGIPSGLGEVTSVYRNALELLEKQEEGRRAMESLDQTRAGARKIQDALSRLEHDPQPKLTPDSEILLGLAKNLEAHLRELYEVRNENAAVAVQIETQGRETVLSSREATMLAESAFLETSELGVAMRDLARVIQEIRPVLEAEADAQRNGAASPAMEACKILGDVAERHREFALRLSREWAHRELPPSEPELALLESLNAHLNDAEAGRASAEGLLTRAPAPQADVAARSSGALKKLLQSAEIAQERLSRLAAAAEKTSRAARRTTGLAERELQSLEALGVRLTGGSGPVEPAETLGVSDFVEDPDA